MATVVSLADARQINRQNRRKKHTTITLTIGERIRLTRANKGFSQDDLGRQIGYSQPEISRMETGEVEVTPKIMAAICKALGSEDLMEAYWEVDPLMALWREWNRKPAA